MGSFISNFAFGTFVKNPEKVYRFLFENGIESRPLICGNIARHPFWLNKFGKSSFKMADIIHDYGIYLPNHANIDEHGVKEISEKFLKIAEPYKF